MTQQHEPKPSLPTIWRVPDELWAILEPLIVELDPPRHRGRPRIDARAALDGIVYRVRTGCVDGNEDPTKFDGVVGRNHGCDEAENQGTETSASAL